MHVIRRRGWEIPESLATPEDVFLLESARRAARALAAPHLVLGAMGRTGSGYSIRLRLFDAARDRWAGRWSGKASPSSELESSTLGGRLRDRLDRP